MIRSSATWLLSAVELALIGSDFSDNVIASAVLKGDTEHRGHFMNHVILAGHGVSMCSEGVAPGPTTP